MPSMPAPAGTGFDKGNLLLGDQHETRVVGGGTFYVFRGYI